MFNIKNILVGLQLASLVLCPANERLYNDFWNDVSQWLATSLESALGFVPILNSNLH